MKALAFSLKIQSYYLASEKLYMPYNAYNISTGNDICQTVVNGTQINTLHRSTTNILITECDIIIQLDGKNNTLFKKLHNTLRAFTSSLSNFVSFSDASSAITCLFC